LEEKAKPLPIYEIKDRKAVLLPELTPKPKKPVTHIAYSMPPKRVKALADALGNINLSNRDVGIKSFDYAYDDLVGE